MSSEFPVRYRLPEFAPLLPPDDIDEGIRGWVNLLRYHGIETCQSCQGGVGHAYPEPTIEFYGNRHIGLWAASVAGMAGTFEGLRAARLDRSWHLTDGGEVSGPIWRLVLMGTKTHPWWPYGTTRHTTPPAEEKR